MSIAPHPIRGNVIPPFLYCFSSLTQKSTLPESGPSFRKDSHQSEMSVPTFFTSLLVNYFFFLHIDIPAFDLQRNNVSCCRDDKIVLVISLEDETMRAQS